MIADPIERIIADALDRAGINYVHESAGAPLDFQVGEVLIEVKQFHSDRTNRQMADHNNVIVIQGREAALWFADAIGSSVSDTDSVTLA